MPSPLAAQPRPDSIRSVELPRRVAYFPSPRDWRDEILYFMLPDRFSDGKEDSRPLLNHASIPSARPPGWRWDDWVRSGRDRYQGGTLKGIQSKLGYIRDLGATTLWIGPVFKQRDHMDGTYHGYGIQDFLDVDPHLGTRQDLVELVAAAHDMHLRIILDVIFNHSGVNWLYANGWEMPPYRDWPGYYEKGDWYDAAGNRVPRDATPGPDDAVWPSELQTDDNYTRAGFAGLGGEQIDDQHAPLKRTDFYGLRDFNFDNDHTLQDLARCYNYWIAMTDCDGFRLDTLKHIGPADVRAFCGRIKEFAANLGKKDFFLVGEVGGSGANADRYLDVLERNLNATLDIGDLRPILTSVAKGFIAPRAYLDATCRWNGILGSHRQAGERHVSILDDHDHVFGQKVRFAADAPAHQAVAGVALQLFTLGVPCVYYGTEQGFAGPEASERPYLPDYGGEVVYLREAMFGPAHPRRSGRAGLPAAADAIDDSLPGFGPFGTAGHHCFDPNHPVYARIAHLIAAFKKYPVLRYGRQYQREISNFAAPFALPAAGEIIPWSRILDDEEALIVVNGNGLVARGGDVVVDSKLVCPAGTMQVVANSAQAESLARSEAYTGPHPVGQRVAVKTRGQFSYVEIRDLPPAECIVLLNHADADLPEA